MTEAEAIVAWVVADDVMHGLIGDRIYPIDLPATPVLPAMTYALIYEGQDPVQDGPGIATPRYRFKVWTERYRELDQIVTALKRLFNARTDGPFRSSVVENAISDHDRATGRWWHVLDVLGTQPA